MYNKQLPLYPQSSMVSAPGTALTCLIHPNWKWREKHWVEGSEALGTVP